MSDNPWDIDVDRDEYADAPTPLREAYKALKQKFGEASQERDQLRSSVQQRSVNDALKDQGFKNPKRVASAILADKIDPSDEAAVTKWLTDNGDDYAKGEAAPVVQEVQTNVPVEQQAAFEQMQQTQALTAPADLTKYEAAFAEIKPEWDSKQVREHLVSKGL